MERITERDIIRIQSLTQIGRKAPPNKCLVANANSWVRTPIQGDRVFDRMITVGDVSEDGNFTIKCSGLMCGAKEGCPIFQAPQVVNLQYDIS